MSAPIPYVDRESPAALKIDRLRGYMETLPPVELPLIHRFTPGLYIREIFMPKGTVAITKIHKTEHPFVISQGRCTVWDEENGITYLKAPHTGITKPGTRRVIHVREDCIWTTFHPTTETDLAIIEEQLILKRDIGKTLDVDDEIMRQLQEAPEP